MITERRLVPPSIATVPGVGGGGAGQVGGVGLPESTGGQGGVDGLTLPDHSTAEGERRQRCEPVSITAELLLELNHPPRTQNSSNSAAAQCKTTPLRGGKNKNGVFSRFFLRSKFELKRKKESSINTKKARKHQEEELVASKTGLHVH